MFCDFGFYSCKDKAGFDRTTLQEGNLAIVASEDEFEREGYARPRFEAVTVARRPRGIYGIADLSFRAWAVRRGRGTRMSGVEPSVLLVTLCEIELGHVQAFMAQFDNALEFIKRQDGFVGSLLFQTKNESEQTSHIVNVARWTDRKSFLRVFSSPAFRKIVRSNFRASGQVMIADMPALKSRKALFS